MPTVLWIKDPSAVLPWTWDWSSWLVSGDTITASSWTVTAGVAIGSGAQAPSNTTTSTTVWLSGGVSGQPYQLTNQVTTALGMIDERSVTIRVQDR